MSNVDTTALRELLKKWKPLEELSPWASLIWVGERQGIQRCAMQLEEVLTEMEKVPETGKIYEMDPYNTSADRPQ